MNIDICIHFRLAMSVTLNVGGTTFQTSKETLCVEEDSYFSAMFRSSWSENCHDKTKEIFIDRDPKIFASILEFLRYGRCGLTKFNIRKLKQDAEYFNLKSLLTYINQKSNLASNNLTVLDDRSLYFKDSKSVVHPVSLENIKAICKCGFSAKCQLVGTLTAMASTGLCTHEKPIIFAGTGSFMNHLIKWLTIGSFKGCSASCVNVLSNFEDFSKRLYCSTLLQCVKVTSSMLSKKYYNNVFDYSSGAFGESECDCIVMDETDEKAYPSRWDSEVESADESLEELF